MRKVLIVPPLDLTQQRADGIKNALHAAQIEAVICREPQPQVQADLLLALDGQRPNLSLLRSMGEVARSSGVPIAYVDGDTHKIAEAVWRAIANSEELPATKTGT